METLLEYKCPSCGGALSFDSGLQKLKCPYCDTELEVETLKQFEESVKNARSDNMSWENNTGDWREGETDALRGYVCASCGGEIVTDVTTAATSK